MLGYVLCSTTAVLGFTAGLWCGLRVTGRLARRGQAIRHTLEVIRDLENRRVATETGREELVRRKAGRPGRVSDGMSTRPGVYARYLRDSALTKKNDAPEGGQAASGVLP